MLRRFSSEQWIPVEVARAFQFFADPRNLSAISPVQMGLNQFLLS
jgi:hypothetical protein